MAKTILGGSSLGQSKLVGGALVFVLRAKEHDGTGTRSLTGVSVRGSQPSTSVTRTFTPAPSANRINRARHQPQGSGNNSQNSNGAPQDEDMRDDSNANKHMFNAKEVAKFLASDIDFMNGLTLPLLRNSSFVEHVLSRTASSVHTSLASDDVFRNNMLEEFQAQLGSAEYKVDSRIFELMRGNHAFQREVAKVLSSEVRDEACKEVFAFLNSEDFKNIFNEIKERLDKLEHSKGLSQEDGDLLKTILSKFNTMGNTVSSIDSLGKKVDELETELQALKGRETLNEESELWDDIETFRKEIESFKAETNQMTGALQKLQQDGKSLALFNLS